jgi:hypothetical protein
MSAYLSNHCSLNLGISMLVSVVRSLGRPVDVCIEGIDGVDKSGKFGIAEARLSGRALLDFIADFTLVEAGPPQTLLIAAAAIIGDSTGNEEAFGSSSSGPSLKATRLERAGSALVEPAPAIQVSRVA